MSSDDGSYSRKRGKASISKSLRQLVWNRYIGARYGIGKCWCCRSTLINAFSFECGHVISEADGGETNLQNLRPICSLCNRSMGTKNMMTFQHENGMTPGRLCQWWEWVGGVWFETFG